MKWAIVKPISLSNLEYNRVFPKTVPLATCVLMDRYIVLIKRLYTEVTVFMTLATMCASKRGRISCLCTENRWIVYTVSQTFNPNPFRGTHCSCLFDVLLLYVTDCTLLPSYSWKIICE